MSALNAALRTVFDWLVHPFREVTPWLGLLPLAIVTTIGVLLIFKYTSNQKKLEQAKDQMFAGIFEIRLFNDNLVLMWRATFDVLRNSLRYFAVAFYPAMLFILPPVLLILWQLDFHYRYHGYRPGETVLLEVELEPPAGEESFAAGAPKPSTELELPAGLRQETPPVWIPTQNRLAWRLRVEDWGRYEIGIRIDGEAADKSLVASEQYIRRSPTRPGPELVAQLLNPAEAPLPAESRIAAVHVDYEEEKTYLDAPVWMWIFFLQLIVIGFALAKPMKITV